MYHYLGKLRRYNTVYKKNSCEENVCTKNKIEWIDCIKNFEKTRSPITYRECIQHWSDFIICSNRQKLN